MDGNLVQTPIASAPLHAVPIQAVAPPAAISTAAHAEALIQQDAQPAIQGNGADRVLQQLRWIKKLVFVCIFLALFAIMKK